MTIYCHNWRFIVEKEDYLLMYSLRKSLEMPQNEAELTEYCQKTGHFGINIAEIWLFGPKKKYF